MAFGDYAYVLTIMKLRLTVEGRISYSFRAEDNSCSDTVVSMVLPFTFDSANTINARIVTVQTRMFDK